MWAKVNFFLILVEAPKSTHNSYSSSRAFHNVLPMFPRRWWKRAMTPSRTPVTLPTGFGLSEARSRSSRDRFGGGGSGWRTQSEIQNKKPRSLLIGSSYTPILFTHSTHTRTHKKHFKYSYTHLRWI